MQSRLARLNSRMLKIATFSLAILMAGSTVVSAGRAVKLNYRLKWIYNASVIGDLYAARKGFFKNAGFNVEVKAGGPERDALRELELGYADFGVASADQVIRAVSKGASLVVVAQLFQVNPLQWIYRSSRGLISKLDDLKGKTIGITFGKNDETIMRTLLAKGHIRSDQVSFYSVRLDYTPFYKNLVDLWPVYANTQAVMLQDKLAKAGENTALLDPGDFGIKFVANSVVVSQKTFDRKAGLVKSFVIALLDGWKASLDVANQKASLEILKQVEQDTPVGILSAQLEKTRQLVIPSNGKPLGTIDFDGWRQTEQIMLQQGQIRVPVNITKYLKPLADH